MTEWRLMQRLRPLIGAFVKAARYEQHLTLALTAVLVIFFLARYLGMGDLPGNSPHPLGWWVWWDQSQYLKSAAAFAVGDLDPNQHWYPLGYPLLGALLFKIAPTHVFFFVNLASFTGFGVLLILLARQWGFSGWAGVAAMLTGAVLPSVLSEQYVIPWTTTPVTVLYAGFFLIYGRVVIDGVRPGRLTLMATLAAVVMTIRPVDILALIPALLHTTYQVVRLSRAGEEQRVLAIRSAVYSLIAGGSLAGLYLLLHIAIYGFGPSEYMRISSQLGFDLSIIPFRYFMIFSDPRDFFGKGIGILERYPLVSIGLFSLVYVTLFWRGFFGITAAVWITFSIYLAYVDFLPSAIWHYKNIHYLKWTFPFLALLTFIVIDHLVRRKQIIKPLVAALVALPLVALNLSAEEQPSLPIQAIDSQMLRLAKTETSIAAIRFDGLGGDDHTAYFGHHTMTVDGVVLEHIRDFRLIPNSNGVYLVFNSPQSVQSMQLTLTSGMKIGPDLTATPLRPRWSLRNPFRAPANAE
jgi:hypothetical protein